MRYSVLQNAIDRHDSKIEKINKVLDNMYLDFLTSQMMWDNLMNILVEKKILTQDEFNAGLAKLAATTKAAMDPEEAKKKEAVSAKS